MSAYGGGYVGGGGFFAGGGGSFGGGNNNGGGYGGNNFGGGGNFSGQNDYGQNSATKGNAGISPMKGQVDRKKSAIIPMSIKTLNQISNRPDDVIEVDGVPVEQAVVIGRVYKMEEQQTRTIFHIDDSTGKTTVAHYNNKNPLSGNGGLDDIYYTENMYIKAVISVKTFKAQKLFISHMLQPVSDYNQITYHFLSIFLASAYRTKGALPKENPNFQDKNANQNQQGNDGGFNGGNNNNNNSYQPLASMNNNSGQNAAVTIRNAINHLQNKAPNGVCKLSQLQNLLKNTMNITTLKNYLTKMQNDGEIFHSNTDDDEDPGFTLLGN